MKSSIRINAKAPPSNAFTFRLPIFFCYVSLLFQSLAFAITDHSEWQSDGLPIRFDANANDNDEDMMHTFAKSKTIPDFIEETSLEKSSPARSSRGGPSRGGPSRGGPFRPSPCTRPSHVNRVRVD